MKIIKAIFLIIWLSFALTLLAGAYSYMWLEIPLLSEGQGVTATMGTVLIGLMTLAVFDVL